MATIEVTGEDDGTSIDVDVGDTVSVRIPDNPTTGYRWELGPITDESLVLVDSGYEPTSSGVGGGGVATWTLHAATAGNVSITVKRWRPWQGEDSVIARVEITFNLHA